MNFPKSHGLFATRNFQIRHYDPIEEREIELGAWHMLPNYAAKKFSKELTFDEVLFRHSNNFSIYFFNWFLRFCHCFFIHFFQQTEKSLIDLAKLHTFDRQESALNAVIDEFKSRYPIVNESNEKDFYEQMLSVNDTKIFLYLHGNTGSRAVSHRIELYKLLRSLGFHVIAFDYRSYGDSTSTTMTEDGVVRDALAVFKYLKNVTKTPLFLWGHSLGTGVLNHMMADLTEQNEERPPRLVVLESPFDNIRNEVREHPFSKLFRYLPWFEYTISDSMFKSNLRFESDKNIAKYPQPINILHAEDDLIVPFKLGYKVN